MRYSIQKGVIPYKGGSRFTVWAPHADDVFAMGTFNNWDKAAHRMKRNSDGWWSIDIPEAKQGCEYRYRIINAGIEYFRTDPYARRVTSSVGNSIITKPYNAKKGEDFNAPALNEMVIYELHIGTFGKQGEGPGLGDLEGAIDRLTYLKELDNKGTLLKNITF